MKNGEKLPIKRVTLIELLVSLAIMALVAGSLSVFGLQQYRKIQFDKECSHLQKRINTLRELSLIFNADIIVTLQQTAEGLLVSAGIDAPFKFESLLEAKQTFSTIQGFSFESEDRNNSAGFMRLFFLAHGAGFQKGILKLEGVSSKEYLFNSFSEPMQRVDQKSSQIDVYYRNEPNRFPEEIYEAQI